MADAFAIEQTSAAIQSLLQAELAVVGIAPGNVLVESIDLLPDPVPPPRVTVFLYCVHENPFLKNRGEEIRPSGPGAVTVQPTPLVVDLDYMITAWMQGTSEEHRVLGHILRVFHDRAELTPAELGPAWGPEESLQITLANPPLEDQARIWTTFGFKRFKLALYYKVRVVPIASTRMFNENRVLSREPGVGPVEPPDPSLVPGGP